MCPLGASPRLVTLVLFAVYLFICSFVYLCICVFVCLFVYYFYAYNTAAAARNSRSEHIFRFSRYSTISNLQSIPRSALEGGVFLGLCRVLVVNQLTVETSIEEADIMAGLQRGCDCVYSSTT